MLIINWGFEQNMTTFIKYFGKRIAIFKYLFGTIDFCTKYKNGLYLWTIFRFVDQKQPLCPPILLALIDSIVNNHFRLDRILNPTLVPFTLASIIGGILYMSARRNLLKLSQFDVRIHYLIFHKSDALKRICIHRTLNNIWSFKV